MTTAVFVPLRGQPSVQGPDSSLRGGEGNCKKKSLAITFLALAILVPLSFVFSESKTLPSTPTLNRARVPKYEQLYKQFKADPNFSKMLKTTPVGCCIAGKGDDLLAIDDCFEELAAGAYPFSRKYPCTQSRKGGLDHFLAQKSPPGR